MRPVINSTKHYRQNSLSSIASGALTTIELLDAVERSTASAVNEVGAGAIVKAIYIEYWLKAGEATNLGSFILTITKVPGTGSGPTFANHAALGDYENKKNILFTSQGLVNNEASTAIPVIRQWIKIPKTKQRMGLGDRVLCSISAVTSGIDFCGFATYKEYY